MSTISDALKKAQNQRQGSLPKLPTTFPHEPPTDRGSRHSTPETVHSRSSGKPSFILILLLVALILAILFYFLRNTTFSLAWNPTREDGRGTEVPASPAAQPDLPPVTPKLTGPVVPPVNVAAPQPAPIEIPVSQPASPKPPRTDVPVLAGTFYSEKNPVAIINGSALKEGETVGAYQIVKILPQSVKLKCDGEEIELRLK